MQNELDLLVFLTITDPLRFNLMELSNVLDF